MVALFAEQSNIVDLPPGETVQGKNNEWFTPHVYIEAAKQVMGDIDLDPASCELANRTVQAKRYYSLKENGLSKPWYGNVWLNCPFSEQADWSKKVAGEYKQGNIASCVFLSQAATERVWFQALWKFSICFTDHQIIFNRPDDKPYHIYHGTCFVYLGSNDERFAEVFSEFGPVIPANVAVRRQKVTPLSLWEGVN
jgi:hypothetical protein